MELIPDLWSLLAVFFITFCGTLVQGAIGFGLGPLSVPLLVLIDPGFIPGPLLLSALVLTGLMSFRDQHSIHLKGVAWAVPGRILGSIGGAFLYSECWSRYTGIESCFGSDSRRCIILTDGAE